MLGRSHKIGVNNKYYKKKEKRSRVASLKIITAKIIVI